MSGTVPEPYPEMILIKDGDREELRISPVIIGIHPDADFRLADVYVSSRHARLVHDGESWTVTDLGSANGTYLGVRRVYAPTPIAKGDRIRVGRTTLILVPL